MHFSLQVSVHQLLKTTVVVERIAKKSFPLRALLVLPIPPCQGVKKPGSPGSIAGSQRSRRVPKSLMYPAFAQGLLVFQMERLAVVPSSPLLVMVCSAVLIQAGQTQHFLCEHAGTKPMGGKQCHHSPRVSSLNAKKPKRHKNIGLLGRCRSHERMVVDRQIITLHPSPHVLEVTFCTKGRRNVY